MKLSFVGCVVPLYTFRHEWWSRSLKSDKSIVAIETCFPCIATIVVYGEYLTKGGGWGLDAYSRGTLVLYYGLGKGGRLFEEDGLLERARLFEEIHYNNLNRLLEVLYPKLLPINIGWAARCFSSLDFSKHKFSICRLLTSTRFV